MLPHHETICGKNSSLVYFQSNIFVLTAQYLSIQIYLIFWIFFFYFEYNELCFKGLIELQSFTVRIYSIKVYSTDL